MTQQVVRYRSQSIKEILNENNLWLLSAQEFNPKEELKRVLNQNNNNSYVYKLIEHVLNETNSSDEEHDVQSPQKKLKTN